MTKMLLVAAMMLASIEASLLSIGASAAEIAVAPVAVRSPCTQVRQCGLNGCFWKRVCQTRCPDYSCYPLYGAYGPYGGTAYWAAYTDVGWWGYRY